MYNATSITYNGVTSESLGAFICKLSASTEDIYVSDRDIIQDSSGRNWGTKSRNYFYKTQANPLKFTLTLGFKESSDEKAREVAKLFFQDKFLPLIPNDTNRIYYCQPESSKIDKYLNGMTITLEMITFNEYSYSDIVTISKDYTGNTSSQFTLYVSGDADTHPTLIIIPLVTGSTIRITNVTDGNDYIEFKTDLVGHQLIQNEVITVDCEKEIISTDQLAEFRYDNMTLTSNFIRLLPGSNVIKVDGAMLLTIKYYNRYLF